MPHAHRKEGIDASVEASLAALKVDKVHIMYLHAPDRTTPFVETCRAMDEKFRVGFGFSMPFFVLDFKRGGVGREEGEDGPRVLGRWEV